MIVFTSLMVIVLALAIWFGLIRNSMVYNFRGKIIKKVFRPDRNWINRLEVLDSVSYYDMLFSIKPLKLNSFFNEEQIKILNQ